jgi:protein TonB
MKMTAKQLRITLIIAVISAVHLILLIGITIQRVKQEERAAATIFKMVDIREVLPPPERETMEVEQQESVTERVEETDKIIKEKEIQYLPQHLISDAPKLPLSTIRSRIVYPPLANRQGIEGTVFLELYIDESGLIRNVKVLKDPGYGFAQAAIAALEGIKAIPARANGETVPVRFRYPVRFTLK